MSPIIIKIAKISFREKIRKTQKKIAETREKISAFLIST